MFSVALSQRDEQVFQPGFSAFASKTLLRLELKNMLWRENKVCKATLLGDLLVDRCAGTF